MNAPIIDPSTLTEEQRKKIRKMYSYEYEYAVSYTAKMKDASPASRQTYCNQREVILSRTRLFHTLFGTDFFKKGE